ncbi:MAG TPA: hypothetical protein VIM73_04800, partial [Polyangiaceae bacterium]
MPPDGAPNDAPTPTPGPSPRLVATESWWRASWRGTELQRLAFSARPLPLVLLGMWAFHRGDSLPDRVVQESDRRQAIVEGLRARGLIAHRADVHFVSPTKPLLDSPVARERALVRAARPGEPNDVYLVDARRSPEGHLIGLPGLYNLTNTSAADEQQLVVEADRASWV